MERGMVNFSTALFGYRKVQVRSCVERLLRLLDEAEAENKQLKEQVRQQSEQHQQITEKTGQEREALQLRCAQSVMVEAAAVARARDAEGKISGLNTRTEQAEAEAERLRARVNALEQENAALHAENAEWERRYAAACGVPTKAMAEREAAMAMVRAVKEERKRFLNEAFTPVIRVSPPATCIRPEQLAAQRLAEEKELARQEAEAASQADAQDAEAPCTDAAQKQEPPEPESAPRTLGEAAQHLLAQMENML